MIFVILFCCFVATIHTAEIDNHLVGEPVVDCQDTMVCACRPQGTETRMCVESICDNTVSLTFTTEKPFNGRVFVKGLADDDRCSRNFATNTDQSKFSMLVNNGDCAMQRQRVQNEQLEGVMFSLVIVVSFHGTFITKVDRAYRCMCFFRNIKRVTNILDISMIGTTELLDTAKMPTCQYTIRSGSPTGELLRYATVGSKIYHVWECDDNAQGFLVHSCWVNDGRGNRFDLLDIDGCAIDPIIQPDVKYEESLTKAYVETHGYKFSDTSVLNYQCVIELCKKAQGECNGLTPPSCGRGKRKRSAEISSARNTTSHRRHFQPQRDQLDENQLDLISTVDILDTLDQDLGTAGPPRELIESLNVRQPALFHARNGLLGESLVGTEKMCFTSPAFGIMMSIMVLLFLTSVVSTSLLCYGRQRYANKYS